MGRQKQKPIPNSFVRQQFAKSGKSYSEVAAAIGVSRNALNDYFHRPNRDSKNMHKKLADYFQVDLALWMYGYHSTEYGINIPLAELNQVRQI